MTFKSFLLSTAAAVLVAGSASAADLASAPGSLPGASAAFNPWQVRVRALTVIPDVTNADTNGLAKNSLNAGYSVVPELDITYYFTKNIAAELILGTTPHAVHSKALNARIGDAWLLPPTLTLQYHFTDFGAFKPYIGAGLNYTIFYGGESSAVTNFKLDNTFGYALQIGFDYMLNKNWGVNVDVKKLFLNTTAYTGSTSLGAVSIDPWLVGVGVTYKF